MTEIKYDSRITEAQNWLESSSILKDSKPYTITPISSDASFRRYFRITSPRLDHNLILMDSPPKKEPLQKFLSRAEIFDELKVTIPKIYLKNSLMGFLIIEDFGDTTLLKKISENKNPTTLLILAIDILLKIEEEYKKKKNTFSRKVKIFSKKILLEELNLFRNCLKYFFEKIKERRLVKGSFEAFKTSYDYTAIQRNLKIIGIFCRLKYRDNKDNYMRYLNKLNQRTLAISENYGELRFITNFFRGISDNPLNWVK